MSRSYTAIKSRFMNENDQSFEEIITELAAIDPDMAHRLQELDWEEILTEVAEKAMRSAAEECRCNVAKYYGGHNHETRSTRARETLIGTFQKSQYDERGPELGVYLVDNRIVLYWDREDEVGNNATLQEWELAFQRCYVECAMAAIMHLIKDTDAQVTRHEIGDASVMFETTVSGG